MGRLGISYHDVSNAALKLKNKGINPTVDGVRTLLGTGSKSTIVPYLRQWRAMQVISQQEEISSPQFLSLIRGLYERLQEEVGTIAKEDFKKQISTSLFTNLQLSEKLEKMELEKKYLEKEIVTLKAQLALAEKEKSYLIKEKIYLKEELEELSKI